METPADYRAVEELTREAFWGYSAPTCDEHYLVHVLRGRKSYLPELCFVAEYDGELSGSVVYSKSRIVDGDKETDVITFGPLSVLPKYHNHGIGKALMRHSIKEAKRQGHRAIITYGHPDYYPRFGFRNSKVFDITTPKGENFDALFILPLYEGALDGVKGAFYEDSAFAVDAKKALDFDKTFPLKEPAKMAPIEALLENLPERARKTIESKNLPYLAELYLYSGREILTWDGIDIAALEIINQTLKEHNLPPKLLPDSNILHLAEAGVWLPDTV